MAALPSINWATICLIYLHCTLVSAAVCNSDVYGIPNPRDCARALRKIPFAALPPSEPQSLQPHFFAEPQYMDPEFGGIDNAFRPNAIVQLPKIWKYNSCHIAIMSEGRPAQPGVVAPQFFTTWRNVVDSSAQFSVCYARGQAQGGYVPLNLPGGRLGAAMYLYTSDSNWNIFTMNMYMSQGAPILPYSQPNQPGLSSNGSSLNQLTLLGNDSASALSIKPLAPGEVVLQDEI